MDPQITSLSSLISTMALLGLALSIAWARFGRDFHVGLWAAAFGLSALSHAAVLCRLAWPILDVPAMVTATSFSYASAAALAIGFRWRGGHRRWRPIALTTAALAAATSVIVLVAPDHNYHRVMVNGFDAAMFFVAARALRGDARERRTAGYAVYCVLLGYAAYIALVAALAGFSAPDGPIPFKTYIFLMVLGVPVGVTGLGLFAMLLIASDLSQRMQRLASLDPLTGVMNRRGIDGVAAKLIDECRSAGRPMTVVVADIDRFKTINDRFGHALGDIVLQRFAQHCEAMVREQDVVARLGGEEFVFVFPEATPRVAGEITDRLRAGLPAALSDLALPGRITASFGVSSLDGPADTLAAMLIRADAALYESKAAGRDRVTVAEARAAATERRFLEAWSRDGKAMTQPQGAKTARL